MPYIDSVETEHFPPMFDELWSEIQDAPGEIFDLDIPELKEEDFNLTEYINGDYDY